MGQEIKYIKEADLVVYRPVGKVDVQKVGIYFNFLKEEGLIHSGRRLIDLSDISDFDIGFSEAPDISLSREKVTDKRDNISVAIFAINEVGFGVGRMFQRLMSSRNLKIGVFKDLESSMSFLELETDTLK